MNAFFLATLLATGFSLPESQSADTEVSTNVVISVEGERFAGKLGTGPRDSDDFHRKTVRFVY